MRQRTSLWQKLGSLLNAAWLWFQASPAEQRATRQRARCWAELRAGQREAKDRTQR